MARCNRKMSHGRKCEVELPPGHSCYRRHDDDDEEEFQRRTTISVLISILVGQALVRRVEVEHDEDELMPRRLGGLGYERIRSRTKRIRLEIDMLAGLDDIDPENAAHRVLLSTINDLPEAERYAFAERQFLHWAKVADNLDKKARATFNSPINQPDDKGQAR